MGVLPVPQTRRNLRQRKATFALLFLTAGALLYGSFYPFQFTPGHHSPFLRWVEPPGLSAIRDYVLNIAVYIPLGFLLAASLPGAPAVRVGGAVAISFLLSGSIELLQAFDRGRVSSLIDLVLNTLGGFCGALSALLPRLHNRLLSRLFASPSAALLLVFALASRLYPFFPNVYRDLLRARWKGVFQPFPFEELIFSTLLWLGVRVLLAWIWKTPEVTPPFALLTLSVPASLLIMDQRVSGASFLGALLALGIGHFLHPSPLAFAPWMLAVVIGRELMPFRPASPPGPFSWVPFSGFLQSAPGSVLTLFDKLFLYGAAIWMWDPDSLHPWRVGLAGAFLVWALEWLQRWLPGRTPEITDALLVLLLSGLFSRLATMHAHQPIRIPAEMLDGKLS